MRTSSFFLLAAVAGVAAAADAPQQIHLAYGAPSYSSMTVSWVTNNVTATSVVKYGLSPSSLTSTAAAPEPPTTYLYTYDHHVTLTGLSPKTVYYYSCGDSAAGFSAVFNFTTAPEPNGEFPFKVAVFADMGNWNSNATFIDLQRLLQPASGGDLETAFILQAGDISYADDAFLHDPLVFGYENAWNTYMTHMQGVGGAWKPLMVAPGNHVSGSHSDSCVRKERRWPFTLSSFSRPPVVLLLIAGSRVPQPHLLLGHAEERRGRQLYGLQPPFQDAFCGFHLEQRERGNDEHVVLV